MLNISGLTKCSMVDYPGKMAAVVFTPGCNMGCYYCHNRWLVKEPRGREDLTPEAVLAFLEGRRRYIEGVVLTGGEPTLQDGLERFLVDVRQLGYAVKLDTNGTRPDILGELVENHLVDYVAMDIKAPREKYEAISGQRDAVSGQKDAAFCGDSIDMEAIDASIRILLQGKVEYEFRTTMAPELARDDLMAMARWIDGAETYVLQQYRPVSADWFGTRERLSPDPLPPERILGWAADIRKHVRSLKTRSMGIETIGTAAASQSPGQDQQDPPAAARAASA